MIALAVTFASFGFVLALGLALTAVLRGSRELSVVDVLLAPAGGLALLMALIVPLNRGGIGVDRFAPPLAVVLVLGAAAVIWRFRATIAPALRRSSVFGLIALIAALVVASPMLSFGFDWFSYANDDGVNYALSAERMRMGGLYDVPPAKAFNANSDIRLDYYFLNGVPSERYAADELLAFQSAVVHENALRMLMPMMIMLHASSLLAAGALVYRGARGRQIAIACCVGLAVSALSAFSAVDQLLGQAVGLIFVSAAITRCCDDRIAAQTGRERAAQFVLAVLMVAGLLFGYPELAPFAIGTIIIYHAVQSPHRASARFRFLGLVAIGTAALLNVYIRNVLFVTFARLGVQEPADLNAVFPYFLLPPGFANLFGIMPIASFPPEPWTSLGILGGLACLAATAVAIVAFARKREPAAILSGLFLCAAAIFYFHGSGFATQRTGFALFKLAMYAEPALIGLLAVAAVGLWSSRGWAVKTSLTAAASVLLALNVFSQNIYIGASRSAGATAGANFTEVRNISGGRFFDRLAETRRHLGPDEIIVSDTFDAVIAKIEGYYGRGAAGMAFPSSPEESVVRGVAAAFSNPFFDHSRDSLVKSLTRERLRTGVIQGFPLSGSQDVVETFESAGPEEKSSGRAWVTGTENSPFNGARFRRVVGIADESESSNILAMVSSSLGLGYFSHLDPTAVYASEPDYFGRGSSMSGTGRYILFEVLHPRAPMRFRLSFTETLRRDGEARLPRASIYGTQHVFFPIYGRGSAAVISDPVTPRMIAGHAYVLLDIGAKAVRFPYQRIGLMRLWGSNISIDPRSIAAFVRDFSVVADHPSPPNELASFPDDLLTDSSDYSGLYEDGWASEHVCATISVGSSGRVTLAGQVPMIGDPQFVTTLRVFVDGFAASSQQLSVGNFTVPILTGSGVHSIELRFSNLQRLPGGDGRPVTVRVLSLG